MARELAVYPTARKVEDLLKRDTAGGGCRLGHVIMTFPQLLETLWRENLTGVKVLSATGERLLLEEALTAARDAEETAWSGLGLGDCLMALIRQFESAGLFAADVNQAADALAPMMLDRLKMIARVFGRYEEALARRTAADSYQRMRAVLQALHSAEASGKKPRLLQDVSLIHIAEIYDFSVLQFMIVTALIRLAGDARLTIQAEAHRISASRFPELTWNRFVNEQSIADQALPDFVRRDGREGCLGFVVEHLFTGEYPAPPADDGTVRVIETPSRHREIEEIGRTLRRLLEGAGSEHLALDRIAIVARDLFPYADYLAEIFARYKIPIEIGYTRPLLSTAPARTVLNLMRAVSGGYPRAALTNLAVSPFFNLAAGRYRTLAGEAGYIDERTRPLDQCLATRRELLAAIEPNRGQAATRLERFDQGAAAWREMLALLKPLESDGTIADHAARLELVLSQLHFESAATPLLDEASASIGPLLEALGLLGTEARAIASARSVTLEEFAGIFEMASAETTLAKPGATGGVRAFNVMDARGLDFDLVFIIGLNDGEFPRYHSDDPLIPDEARAELNRALAAALRQRWGEKSPSTAGHILRTRFDHNAEDWFLFFLAVSMPAKKLVLSHATTNESGNPVVRSPFVEEIIRLLGESLITRVPPEDFIPPPNDCFAASEFLNSVAERPLLRAAMSGVIASDDRLGALTERSEIERKRECYLKLPTREETATAAHDDVAYRASNPEKAALADAYNGRVAAGERLRVALSRNRDGTARQWSEAQLNEIASCGFRFFARRILQLRDDDEPDYEQSAIETGGLVHQILQDLVSETNFSDLSRVRETAHRLLEIHRERARTQARDATFVELEWRTIEKIIEEFVVYECRRQLTERPPDELKLEHPFLFTLTQPGGESADEIVLAGRIDRLELYRGRDHLIHAIKIIDYKTSRGMDNYQRKLDHELGVTDFQMPVYALAAQSEFSSELAADLSVKASYMVLRHRDKETKERILPNASLTALESGSSGKSGAELYPDRIRELVASAIRGEFEVDPMKCDQWCPYRPFCRYHKAFD
ncbi:MAG: PD-(D/E)XK nuclease family protein [Candidatus Binataceae bacterium]